jgi:hypothetical protein
MAGRDGDDSYWVGVMRGETSDISAEGYQQHLDRIAELVVNWQAGLLTVEQKRRAISDENKQFYGANCPKHLTWR